MKIKIKSISVNMGLILKKRQRYFMMMMQSCLMIQNILWRKAMREEYDIENLNPRKNPYSKRLKKQITINIDNDTIDFFKEQSEESGIPYQTLINLYLSDCAKNRKRLQMSWE